MKIIIKGTNLDLTPSIVAYVERKLGVLGKIIPAFDEVADLKVEIGRTTLHHKKGPVFRAEASLYLPKKNLRAEEEHEDVRAAVDIVEDKLRREIKKYKSQHAKNESPAEHG